MVAFLHITSAESSRQSALVVGERRDSDNGTECNDSSVSLHLHHSIPRVTQNPELTEVSLHPSVAHGSNLKNWISEQRRLRLAGFQFPFSGEKQGGSSPHFHATINISVTLKVQRSFNSCPPARVSHWDQLS